MINVFMHDDGDFVAFSTRTYLYCFMTDDGVVKPQWSWHQSNHDVYHSLCIRDDVKIVGEASDDLELVEFMKTNYPEIFL